MPGINNINNVNGLDTKKVVSKLSFQVGEVFQAKVVEVKDQGNEVTLKTMDGWQFAANAKIPLDMLPKGLVKFKVVGYEDGKLQIEVVPETPEGASIEEKSIQTILKQQNLFSNKADYEMLKSMVSHDIPLTKENISAVKTIIDFKGKISANVGEEDIFISKYLQSKGIDINSVEGKNANAILKGFFSELKKTSVEDLVTLKENGIDITEDNLKSFNKVFKEDTGLYKQITEHMNKDVLSDKSTSPSTSNISTEKNNMAGTLTNIKREVVKNILDAVIEDDGTKNNLILDENITESSSKDLGQNQMKTDQSVSKGAKELKIIQTILENDIPITKENVSTVKAIIDLKEQILIQPKNETEVIKQYLNSKNIPEDSEKGKALNNSIREFFNVIKNEPIKEFISQLQVSTDGKTQGTGEKIFEKQFKTDLPAFKEIIKDVLKGNDLIKNNQLAEDNITVTKENVSNVKAIIDLKEQILTQPKNEIEVIKQYLNSKNIPEDSEKGKALNNSIREFFNAIKDEPIKEVVSHLQASTDGKTQVSAEKIFEKQFKADLPAFKEIIKDVLKGNDQIKSSQITENDIPVTKENVSTVKAIMDLKEQILAQPKNEARVIKLYLDSKNIPEDSEKGKVLSISIKEFFEMIKSEPVKEVLSKLQPNSETEGTDIKKFDNQFKEDLPIFKEIIKNILKGNELAKGIEIPKGNQLAENIKSQIAQKTDFMKDIIKSMAEGDWSQIKNSINDIKVFNTVSNQYYYMDVPVNINEGQYECKLLIKDDRKKGKKIDSKNVKMFVSVKTINIGKVDVYVKVSDRNVNIDLKCNENWIKIFKKENSKLVSTLQDMNYNVNLNIEKQIDEANIVNTREFFQDNELGSINVMV